MARNKKVEILSHSGEVLHPITDGDCVIFPDGETLTHKLSEDEAVMYTPEVVNSSPMFKVGEGDTSDYSTSVLDGAYQEAILKGQTYVNTIQEPSADEITLPTPFTEYERTQSKTFTEMNNGTFGINLVGQSYVNCIQEPSEPSYVALGENLEFQNKKVEYTNDGQIKSAMVKGQTLVNMFPNRNVSRTVTTTGQLPAITVTKLIKPIPVGGKAIFIYNNTFPYAPQNGFIQHYKKTDTGYSWIGSTGFSNKLNGKNYIIISNTYDSEIAYIDFYVTNGVVGDYSTNDIMLIEYQEGMENWDIPYFQGMQSVTMSTELENVCSRYNSSVAKNGKTFTVGTLADRSLSLSSSSYIMNYGFKQNTKYLIQFKISNLVLDGLNSIRLYFYGDALASGNCLFGENAIVDINKNGIYRAVLTTTNVINTSQFVIKGTASQWENTTSTTRKLTISQIMCIEYQNGMENWDLPYFETTQLMKPLKVQSINKNLCYGTWTTGSNNVSTMDNYFRVREGEYYRVSHQGTRKGTSCHFYDKNKVLISTLNGEVLQAPSGAYYGRWALNIDKQYLNTVQIEQSNISGNATSFIEHYHKTTSALEPITLRAIGNVKDTLDLSTGEYVQRIGEIVLDGSDDEGWKMGTNSEVNAYRFDTEIISGKIPSVSNTALANIMCDKYKAITFSNAYYNRSQGIAIFSNTHIVISNGMTNLEDFKLSLQNNPIKVQYELANPITRKISLEYPNLQTYTDITHVQSIAMDGTLIPNIYLPSDISYKAMLKPNTSYNVIVDREVIDSTNQLTVNLGGTTANITANRTLITTPSTLSNETLTFSGKDNRLAKVMLIEGSTLINGDLPHFDGIGDVKLGRVVENLCMSNEYPEGNGRTTDTYSNNSITSKFTASGSRVYLFDLIKPIQNGKKYFVYAPCSQTCSIGFKTIYNGTALYSVAKTSIDNYTILSIDNEILRECRLFIGQLGAMPVNTTMTIRRPIICEYIDGMENWDWESIGYFTGTRNIGNEFMRIGNKNLFDGQLRDGYYSNGEFKANANNKANVNIVKIKPNTTYTISSDSGPKVSFYDINKKLVSYNPSTTNSYTFTVPSDVHYINFHGNGATYFQIEEATSATSFVAHKHNSLHILPNEQIPLTFVQGATIFSTTTSFAEQSNNTMASRIRTGLLDLEPNETYRISCGDKNYIQATAFYNNSNIGAYTLGGNSDDCIFTTTKDVHKICINIAKSDLNSNITPSVLHQVRLEKVTDVTLRSVGNVKDELDLTRGVYIQRIGEIVIDGNGNYTEHINTSSTHYGFRVPVTLKPKTSSHEVYPRPIISDKLPSINYGSYFNGTAEGVSMYEGESTTVTNIYISFDRNRINMPQKENNINHVKNYCKTHPMIVQYVLETPIEHKINIPMKNESNQTIAKPNGIFTLPLMYSETNHVDINSQIYPKVESRDYISYPVIANNSQLHTVFHNKLGTGNLTVNLCGTNVTSVDGTSKCTITTPSTISQYELRLSGARNKVSNVCVFSGDYMNVNVPYVQGMMNAENPIVKNVGKNLFDGVVKNGESWWDGKIQNGVKNLRRSVNLTPVKPNTEYSFKLANGGTNFMAHGKNGKFLKYIGWFAQGVRKFTTPSDCYYIHWYNDIDDFTDFYIEESSTSSQYEPYKENICEPKNGVIELTEDMFEQGSFTGAVGSSYESLKEINSSRVRTKKLLKLNKDTSYVAKCNKDYLLEIAFYDEEGLYAGTYISWTSSKVFNTDKNCYIAIKFRKISNSPITVGNFNEANLLVQEVNKTITLRSLPSGVRDELNLQTGEYIQRIGEIIFDGSSDENWRRSSNSYPNNIVRFDIDVASLVQTTTVASGIIIICDKYNSVGDISQGIEILSHNTKSTIVLGINSSKLYDTTVDGLKQYLQQNPITVQYQLATPIVKQIDINNFPHSYKDGHVIIESNDPSTNVTAQMTYRCVTNRSGQIQEHTEQVEKQERQINELETLILENIRQQQNRSQNFLTSLISTLEIEEE